MTKALRIAAISALLLAPAIFVPACGNDEGRSCPNLRGDWSLITKVADSNCDGIKKGAVETETVKITQDGCELTLDLRSAPSDTLDENNTAAFVWKHGINYGKVENRLTLTFSSNGRTAKGDYLMILTTGGRKCVVISDAGAEKP